MFVVTLILISAAGVALTAHRDLLRAAAGWLVYCFALFAGCRDIYGPAAFDALGTWAAVGWIGFFAACTLAVAVFVHAVAWPALQRGLPARKAPSSNPAFTYTPRTAPVRPAWGRTRFVAASRAPSAARRRYTPHTR